MKELNFNMLAWEAPEHDGEYGYLPTDEYYSEICGWLKTCKETYRFKKENKTTVRRTIEYSTYDVIATFNHDTKMISYYFTNHNEYQIAE